MATNHQFLLATRAMWVGDYQNALRIFKSLSESEEESDVLYSYWIRFGIAITATAIKDKKTAQPHIDSLNNILTQINKVPKKLKDERKKIPRIHSVQEITQITRQHYTRKEEVMSLIISPGEARKFLGAMERNAEFAVPPTILTAGLFKYALSKEIYQTSARAYAEIELPLERLTDQNRVAIITRTPNVYFVKSENQKISSSLQREGLVMSQYIPSDSEDQHGPIEIKQFLNYISEILST